MNPDLQWSEQLTVDIEFGYLHGRGNAARRYHPQIVLNDGEGTVLQTLRDELKRCSSFAFSVAFVSPRAIALLKQELVEFGGTGQIVTSDYLSFNSPTAFAELLNLTRLGIDVRIHSSQAFHPKGYVFHHDHTVTAMVGSSNLTENALARNTEWNLKVSAAKQSDLALQVSRLIDDQAERSDALTQEWIDAYSRGYVAPVRRPRGPRLSAPREVVAPVVPNVMQREALDALAAVRQSGERRAVVISATGTGKTILSALDAKAFNPDRLLFLVHREQILDRTIEEYRRVLGGSDADYGKLAGGAKGFNARYVFATVQSFVRPDIVAQVSPDDFDYIVIDEAHRVGAPSYRRVIERMTPTFLLGMTATPERTDAFNVFESFDHNVAYEIRLNRALEADMLCPFHYYGITDVRYDDGRVVTAEENLAEMASPERVDHLIDALETYGQAGVPPRGLIFCARTVEAQALSEALNQRSLRGRPLRTIALTGADSVIEREAAVARLEQGELDYILSVDVFSEGVDIPTVNQVVMLRQTQSAIVFVQQLGRGLRKAHGKEFLVVIDMIGNHANNYLIPVALFGDNSLNKESLRKNLIAAEEIGVLAGLSSVRFDKIAHQRVLDSIAQVRLDSMQNLKAAVLELRDRLGRAPALWDFYRFDSVDPVVLATKKEHYPELLRSLRVEDLQLTPAEGKLLHLLSHEVLPAKRLHEFVLIRQLIKDGHLTPESAAAALQRSGVPATARQVGSALDTLTVTGYSRQLTQRYAVPLAHATSGGGVRLLERFATALSENPRFAQAVEDLLRTGEHLTLDRYGRDNLFVPGRQYTRSDVTRLVGWPRSVASTIYGYKTDVDLGVCANFVTLHKSDTISATTAYEDELLDPTTMRWFTRSRRTLQSNEVVPIVENTVDMHIFVQKDNADDFFYLGLADAEAAEQTTLPGRSESIVKMILRLREPIDAALFGYFHPLITQ